MDLGSLPAQVCGEGRALAHCEDACLGPGVLGATGHIPTGKDVVRAARALQGVSYCQEPLVICAAQDPDHQWCNSSAQGAHPRERAWQGAEGCIRVAPEFQPAACLTLF